MVLQQLGQEEEQEGDGADRHQTRGQITPVGAWLCAQCRTGRSTLASLPVCRRLAAAAAARCIAAAAVFRGAARSR